MRESGILLPVFSLPGAYGIGGFTEEARRFVDFLKKAGQSYWQILPLGPTGYGDSPYQSFSTFAGNPYFISLSQLVAAGYLEAAELADLEREQDAEAVDYGWLYGVRFPILRKAYDRWKRTEDPAFRTFTEENRFWLDDYALFMAVKDHFGGRSFREWDDDIRYRRPAAMERYAHLLFDEIGFYQFLQYLFAKEWFDLKAYANSRGVQIIGDIPIYVSPDSADFWAAPELFQVDEDGVPTAVAGCPPDGFSEDGQLWGNPLYNWEAHEASGFAWWIRRMERCRALYDVVRIDHFRGFDEYFAIPYGDKNARGGSWKQGPGMKLFRALKAALGEVQIIAEDLGYITDSVRQLVSDSGFPNMKVLEFAFDSRDSSGAGLYLPHNYGNNCVVYTGTHDNETLVGWLDSILPKERQMVRRYLGTTSDDAATLAAGLVRLAEASIANLCVIPMQDWLGLDNRARVNHPSTLGGNWTWRMKGDAETDELAAHIRDLCATYGRTSA